MTQRMALAVDDEPDVRRAVVRALRSAEYEVVEASDAVEACGKLQKARFDLVVTDLRMPRGDGLDVVRAVRKQQAWAAVVVLTGQGSVSDCVEAMRAGAQDFITKPFNLDSFTDTLRRATAGMRPPASSPPPSHRTSGGRHAPTPSVSLVGDSPAMAEVLSLIDRVAPTSATVLLLGETGTGKEVVARLIHGLSPRSTSPFVAVNCGAVPENLIESELFGHARGAFTGATERRVGRFAQSDGGTLFLDEIGELPLQMQVRLLRALQSHEIVPVGDSQPVHIDLRVIAATNRDLVAMVHAGQFREDLFYRLNVVQICIPPLRTRGGDAETLFQIFVERSAARQGRHVTISSGLTDALVGYEWPGNVRELENLAERLVILDRSGELTAASLPPELLSRHAHHALYPATHGTANSHSAAPTTQPSHGELNLGQTMEETEWRLIDEALRRAGGNKAQAARMLSINRTTLVEKLKRRPPGRPPLSSPGEEED